ncbi:phage/plasmid primase, P4 family [Bartonella sp. HY329]|uniref:DNA primase family protein n=1 Tax=unclassified Bartonella TaxID=2645622 RepID=UPI0021CA9A35|nr:MULTISPECIES: phage/plasmid primase, P4 family [unclassified Bartonella]UXM94305.1 phage/plasmid primase, P4 family [Bartonella sp. HY329]UXN08628.1 phage/plasmid primase, P4 family [Bartonella sp. HY328]
MSDKINKNNNIPESVKAMLDAANAQEAAALGQSTQNPHPLGRDNAASLESNPQELLSDCMGEPETDIGNGRRFLHRYGDTVLHVARIGWHGFDGKRWKEDDDGSVVRPLAQNTAELIDNEAHLLTATEDEQKILDEGRAAKIEQKKMGYPKKDWDSDKLGRYMELDDILEKAEDTKKLVNGRKSSRHRHAKSSAGTSKLNNMLTEALPHVAKVVTDMNADLYAFNTSSGTLRFYREDIGTDNEPKHYWNYRLDPHRPEDLISKLAPTKFEKDCEAPNFHKFLTTVLPDADIRLFLQRFMGYCLLGSTAEQCLLFFYGVGRNGKSTFLDALSHVIGDYAVTLSIDSFAGDTRRGGAEATPDLARLPGARLVAASEPEMGVKLKDALIKTLTGGEVIPVRRLHEDFFEVHPQFKIILSGNHKPRIDDTSDGIWRRVFLVPWEVQIPKEDVDRALPDKLRHEASGIFAWMVSGALDYLNYGLNPPEKVLLATNEYREESDPIGAFIRAACIVTGKEEDTSSPGDLYIGYCNFASKEGAAEFKQNTFSRRFPDYTRLSFAAPDGQMRQFWKAKSGTTVYKGIRVKDSFVTPDNGRESFAEVRG